MDSQQCVLIESQQGYKFLIKHHKWSDLMWTQRAQHKKSRARTHRSRNPHRIQSRIIIIDIQSRFCYNKHIQIQSSSCMITNTHIISKRHMTLNQIQKRNTPETNQIQSSTHMHIMHNTSRYTYIQIDASRYTCTIVCTHIHLVIHMCDSHNIGTLYSNAKYFQFNLQSSTQTKKVSSLCARFFSGTQWVVLNKIRY